MVGRGQFWWGTVRSSGSRRGPVTCGRVRFVEARSEVRLCNAMYGRVWYGVAGFGGVCSRESWQGKVRSEVC